MRSTIHAVAILFALLAGPAFAQDLTVARATFAAGIQDREPVAASDQFLNELSPVFFFTEIQNAEGKVITHRWVYNDNLMAQVDFDIRGPRWRVYSSKVMLPFWTGQWRVDVMSEDVLIGSWEFEYLTTY